MSSHNHVYLYEGVTTGGTAGPIHYNGDEYRVGDDIKLSEEEHTRLSQYFVLKHKTNAHRDNDGEAPDGGAKAGSGSTVKGTSSNSAT